MVCFRKALRSYRRAHEVREHYYPGINVAALQYMLGETAKAADTAATVLESLERHALQEDSHWVQATRGDALVLRGDHPRAEDAYRAAVKDLAPRDRCAICAQLQMLVRAGDGSLAEHWTPEKLTGIFGPCPEAKPSRCECAG